MKILSSNTNGDNMERKSNIIWWTSMCEFIPEHIDWLFKSRETVPDTHKIWINHSIIMLTAIMLEGSMELYLRNKLRVDGDYSAEEIIPENKLKDRLFKNIDDEIKNATWGKYNDLFQIITGKKISESVSSETIKAVNHLFKLRNSAIAHGNALNIEGPIDTSIAETKDYKWEQKNLNNVSDYLKQKKLWEHNHDYKIPEINFFTDKIATHFFENAICYAYEIGASPTTKHSLPLERINRIIEKKCV